MKTLIVVAICLVVLCVLPTKAQLLMQNFSSSATVSDYVSATPSNGQFTSISASTGSTVSIVSEQLEFARTSGGEGFFSRSTSFSTVPTTLMVQFSLELIATGGAQTTACLVKVGNGLNDVGTPLDANANIFARFGINYTATAGQFAIQNITAGTTSANFTGKQTITFVMNKSGADLVYVAPTGVNRTLATDRYDVYVGTTLVQNAVAALTASVNLANFKFNFRPTNNGASLRIDNIYINSLNGTGSLPSGTFTLGGNNGNFTSITNPGGLFNVLNNLGSIPTGGYTFNVSSNLTETGTNPLYQIGGMSVGNEIKIQPDGATERLISGAVNANGGMIRLDGADYTIFDGRNPNDLAAGGTHLLFRNTNTTGNATNNATFVFTNDAKNHNLQYCQIEGAAQTGNSSATAPSNGVIRIDVAGGTTSTGNSNITIQYCKIRGITSGATPKCLIYSSGTATSGQENTDIVVQNCTLSDFFSVNPGSGNGSTVGICVLTGNVKWTIKNNTFFQTATRTVTSPSGTYDFNAIRLNGAAIQATIQSNVIGGSNETATGSAWFVNVSNTASVTVVRMRVILVSNCQTALIEDNIINNFRVAHVSNTLGLNPAFIGMALGSGTVTVTNNMIGSSDNAVTNAIQVDAYPANGFGIQNYGINVSGGTSTLNQNKIGAINTSSQSGIVDLAGIFVNGGTASIQNTIINNLITYNGSNLSTLVGINYTSSTNGTMASNTISNLTNNSTNTSATLYGINQTGTGSSTITNNTIHTLSSAAQQANNTDNVSAAGIRIAAATTNININTNTIHTITTAATTASTAAGILLTGGAQGNVHKNRIYNIRNNLGGNNAMAVGVLARNIGASLNIYNNMIGLGLNADGTNNATPSQYVGFWQNFDDTDNIRFSFNSVAIAGSNTTMGSTAKTFGFLRGDNDGNGATLVTTPTQVFNNVFHNTRIGGGGNFALANQETTTNWAVAPPCGTSPSPDFNVLYTDAANGNANGVVAEWLGTPLHFADWKTNSTADAFSVGILSPIAFDSPQTADLHVPVVEHRLDGFGLPLPTLTLEDYDGNFRRGPDIGADEVENTITFIGTDDDWHNPNNWDLDIVPTCADNVVIPNGKSVKIYPNKTGLCYTLTINNGGTLTLADNTSALEQCWLNGNTILPSAVMHNGEVIINNGGTFVLNQARLSVAGHFTNRSTNFQKGTSTTQLNVDRPTVNSCLADFIEDYNNETVVSNIKGNRDTNFHNLEILNNGNTTIDNGVTRIIQVGDATTDAGYLDIQGTGWLAVNGNTLVLEGTLIERNGTITGSNNSKLYVFGRGDLGGTLKFTSANSIDNRFSAFNLRRHTSGLVTLGNHSLLIGDTLQLFAGRLRTNALEVSVLNNHPTDAVVEHLSNATQYNLTTHAWTTAFKGWIWGNLRRAVQNSGSITYDFPVGNGTHYQLARMEIVNAFGASTHNILAYFLGAGISASTSENCSGEPYVVSVGGSWQLDPNAAIGVGASYNLQLFPTNFAFVEGLCLPNITIAKSDGGAYSFDGSTYTEKFKRSGFTSFSNFLPVHNNSLLPVSLINFEAMAQQKEILLQWTTAQEYNSARFEVQRSYNGVDFFTIGTVAARGSSNTRQQYDFVDRNPASGTNYYRLKQIDLDDTFEFSKIIDVSLNHTEQNVTVYPNPMQHHFYLAFAQSSKNVSIQLKDVLGKIVWQTIDKREGYTFDFNLPTSLSKGVYWLQISTDHAQVQKKVMIE